MTRAVIFDLDGTLIDSLPDVMNALNAVLADWGRRPVVRDEASLMVGGGAEPLLERAFDATGDALPAESLSDCVDAFTAYYRENPATETTVFDGAVQALEVSRAQAVSWSRAVFGARAVSYRRWPSFGPAVARPELPSAGGCRRSGMVTRCTRATRPRRAERRGAIKRRRARCR